MTSQNDFFVLLLFTSTAAAATTTTITMTKITTWLPENYFV